MEGEKPGVPAENLSLTVRGRGSKFLTKHYSDNWFTRKSFERGGKFVPSLWKASISFSGGRSKVQLMAVGGKGPE